MHIGKNISFNIGRSIGQIDPVAIFAAGIASDGGTIDQALINQEFNAMQVSYRNRAKVLLIPGAWKNNKIYGMNPVTGDIVPFTFGRAGSATYFDKNGIMQTAAAGVPRIDYDPLTKVVRGWFFEHSSSTNLISTSLPANPYASQTVVNTGWGFPDKLIQGVQWIKNPGVTESSYRTYTGATVGSTYTLSFFIKMSDGSEPVFGLSNTVDSDLSMVVLGNLVNPSNITKIHVGNGIYRCIGSYIASVSTISNLGIARYNNQTRNKTFVVGGYQLEVGNEATSYIETIDGQITRFADTVVPVSNIIPYDSASVYMDFNPRKPNPVAGSNVGYFGYNSSNFFWGSTNDGASTCIARPNSGLLASASSYVPINTRAKVLTSFSGGVIKISANGSSPAIGSYTGAFSDGSTPRFLNTTGSMKNHVRCLAIFSEQLSDGDHIALTTL